jgi:hypothetical protein
LGDPEAIVVLDETAERKRRTITAGVARQHAGITGQVENCQAVVFLAYVTARARTLSDFRLCLTKTWFTDDERRERAKVLAETEFAARTVPGTLRAAAGGGAPFASGVGNEVCGRCDKLRKTFEKAGRGTCQGSRQSAQRVREQLEAARVRLGGPAADRAARPRPIPPIRAAG